jgi:hypothetical protein
MNLGTTPTTISADRRADCYSLTADDDAAAGMSDHVRAKCYLTVALDDPGAAR